MNPRRTVLVAAAALALAWAGPTRLARLPPLCLSQVVLGHSCPGCGITRGVSQVLQGHPRAATNTHPASLPVTLIGALLLWRWCRQRPRPGQALESPPR